MLSSKLIWSTSAFLTFCLGAFTSPAMGQSIYNFTANYDTLNTSKAISSSISEAFITGESNDALYGLNNINGATYTQIGFTTGIFRFNTYPATFGLQGRPLGSVVFSGSGYNKLFGTDSATGIIDFSTLTATSTGAFTITGGEGMFKNAIGTLAFSEVDQLNLKPDVPFTGRAVVSGTIQIVSEPNSSSMAFSFVMFTVVGILFRRFRQPIRFGR